MSSRLDIESLRVLTSVVDNKRVGIAAKRLNLSQSAVSHKIKRLEARVGMKLLKRNSQGFASTDEGINFLHYARRLISLHDEMLSDYPVSSLQGTVALGATEDATHGELAKILGLFRRSHPQIKLQIKIAQSMILEDWLKAGAIDLAILQLFENQVRDTDQVLWSDQLKWVMSADFPLEFDQDIPFVSFSENCYYRKAAIQALKKQGRKLDIVFECQSVKGVNEALKQGIGIGLVTSSVVDNSLVEVDMALPKMPGIVHALRHLSSPTSASVDDLKNILFKTLAQRPQENTGIQ